tara:strand:- start:21 stop:230 length:210 start_codon:yes stop_codon:yes gene_type:complete
VNVTTRVVGTYKIIEVREETDGSIHRRTISPSDDTSSESAEIKTLVAEHHTDELKTAYINHLNTSNIIN